ncbi:hypothetical protein PQQ96_31930 [Paraburkholderia sediminicola]|uniref:hypothetical protein n=1 Tax=Paraburkholderia sediminicola TaxID=458836 RepID=UPI0038BAAA18
MNDVMMQTLLARLGVDGTAGLDPAAQLAALASTDPTLAPVVSLLQQRLATAEVVDVDSEEVSEPPLEAREGVSDLAQLARKMFAELKVLRMRNDSLAAALGACRVCWGEDPGCQVCGGDGGVGAFQINARLFNKIVRPALKQLDPRSGVVRS